MCFSYNLHMWIIEDIHLVKMIFFNEQGFEFKKFLFKLLLYKYKAPPHCQNFLNFKFFHGVGEGIKHGIKRCNGSFLIWFDYTIQKFVRRF